MEKLQRHYTNDVDFSVPERQRFGKRVWKRLKRRFFFCGHRYMAIVYYFSILIPLMELSLFLMLSDDVWQDLLKQSNGDAYYILSFIYHCITIITCIIFLLLSFDAQSTTQFEKYTARWWVRTIVSCLLGFASSIYLFYSFASSIADIVNGPSHASWAFLFDIFSTSIEKILELLITIRSLYIIVLYRFHFDDISHRKIAATLYLSVMIGFWLLRSILTANLNSAQFKKLLDSMSTAASNTTLSLVRPGFQMFYFRTFIHFGSQWASLVRTKYFKKDDHYYDNEDDDISMILGGDGPNRSVESNVSKSVLLGVVFSGCFISLHWIENNHLDTFYIAHSIEGIVYLGMAFYCIIYFLRNRKHSYLNLNHDTISILLVGLGSLGAIGLSFAEVATQWYGFFKLLPIPLIFCQSVLLLYHEPKGFFRTALLAVDVSFIYFALSNESEHVSELIEEKSPINSALLSIYWFVLEFYAGCIELLIDQWLDETIS